MDRKAMLGQKVRRLRMEQQLTQSQMADRLAVSASYINLVESNQRPVSVSLLLKLGKAFDIDLQEFAEDEEGRLLSRFQEMFGDPFFEGKGVTSQDLKDVSGLSIPFGEAILALYRAYLEGREHLENLEHLDSDSPLPSAPRMAAATSTYIEEVREFFEANTNHFAVLEEQAETLWKDHKFETGNLYAGLVGYLLEVHSLKVRVRPDDFMDGLIRRFDYHGRQVYLSENLPIPGRTFQLGCQIALLAHNDLIEDLLAGFEFSSGEARSLAQLGLTNYFAGAVMMPYDRFLTAARTARYDIKVLEKRFDSTLEQVCHRLTSLQRPGNRGIPFFMIRIDKAGNVSKRFSASSFQFARYGGPCPRWHLHDAFHTPNKILTQMVKMPDGRSFFSLASSFTRVDGGYANPPQVFALALGCDINFARELVYSDGIDLENQEAATPIGLNCRLCERLDCNQRAYPPASYKLDLNRNERGVNPYSFVDRG